MIKEKLEEDLFDKLPDNGRFVLFYFKLSHYAPRSAETVLYAIPKELA